MKSESRDRLTSPRVRSEGTSLVRSGLLLCYDLGWFEFGVLLVLLVLPTARASLVQYKVQMS